MPLRIELDDPPPIRIAPVRRKTRRGWLIVGAIILVLGLGVYARYAWLRVPASRPGPPPDQLDYVNVDHGLGVKLPPGWKRLGADYARTAEMVCGNGARKVLVLVADLDADERAMSEADYVKKVAVEEGLGASSGQIRFGNVAAEMYMCVTPAQARVPKGVSVCAVARYQDVGYVVRGSACDAESVEFSKEFDAVAKGVFVLPRSGGPGG